MGNLLHSIPILAAAPLTGLVVSLVLNRVMLRWPAQKTLLGGIGCCVVCGVRLPWRALLPGRDLQRAPYPCGHAPPRWRAATLPVLVAGSAALALAHPEGPWPVLAPGLMLLYLLYPLAVIDIISLNVETRLVVLGLALRFAGLAFFAQAQLVEMLAGMLMGAGLFAMVEVVYRTLRGRPGLGEGDAAVVGLIGAFVGWQGVLPVVALGAVAGLVVGVPALLLARRSLATPIPFVPFLSLAGMAVYLAQTVWPDHWMRLILAIQPLALP